MMTSLNLYIIIHKSFIIGTVKHKHYSRTEITHVMANITLFVNYRPLKIGFCVRADNVDDITKAAELNTLLWGGIYNPIIPVGADLDFAKQLVKVFQIDLLYPVTIAPEIESFIKLHNHLQWRNPYDRLLFQQLEKETKMGVLDVSNIIEHYWEKEFKNTKRSNCVLPTWSKKDALSPVFTMQFGNYPTEPKLSFDHKVGFLRGLRAKTQRIVKDKNIDQTLYGKMTPILLTEDRLLLAGGGRSWDSHGVYLGMPGNPQDLINFWNLRASGIDLHFVPIEDPNRVKAFVKEHLKSVQKRDAAQRFPRGVGFWYRYEIGHEKLQEIADQFMEKGQERVFCGVSEHSWNGLNIKPPKPEFESQTLLAGVDWSYKKPSVSFQLPTKPAKSNRYNSKQELVLDVKPIGEHVYKGYTLRLPFFPDLNEWYARNVVFHPDELRAGKDEIGVVIDLDDSTSMLHPIKIQEIIQQIFDRAKIQAKPSKPGLIAQRLIERMGGDLDDCRVFKVRGVRKLINSLSTTEFVPRSNAEVTIRDVDQNGEPSFDNHKSLHIQQRDAQDLTPHEVFDYLLDKNVFTIGLAPVCPNCELEFWLSLRDADDEVKCEYCGHQFKIAPQLRHRGDFRFRRSGLFGRADNQEGAVPVILTLLQMLRRNGMEQFMYSTNLKLNSDIHGIDCETDLVIVGKDNWKDKVTVVIGECKTNDQITDQDVANLLKVKQVLDASGVETFLLFAKTSEFTEDEMKRFLPLAAQDINPILFTQNELEPYDPYDYYHDNNINLPHIYTHQFDEMGQNSYEVYLKSKMKNALILHGTGNNPHGNWFPWLKDELEKKGYLVWVPNLPNSAKPNTKNYNDFILGNTRWSFNEKSILIGHSSGAVAMLGLLQELPEGTTVDTCIFVSAFKDNLGSEEFNGLFEKPFDFERIKTKAKKFIFIHSDNDPYCPLEHAKFLAKKLGGELIIKKGQGHFNLEHGPEYKEFPFLLELVTKN